MRWTERQRTMLGAMGIALWGPDRSAGVLEDSAPSSTVDAPRAEAALRAAQPRMPAAAAAAPIAMASAVVVDDPVIAALDWEPLRARVAACNRNLSGAVEFLS